MFLDTFEEEYFSGRYGAASAEALIGRAGSGKTQGLIDRIESLLDDGAKGDDILVMCATPRACTNFQERLECILTQEREREQARARAGVRICTPREFALGLLTAANAIGGVQQPVSVLLPFEEAFLIEDVRTCGCKDRRLKEMLKFFARSVTEVADFKTDWLKTGEERVVYETLCESLDFMGAVPEWGVSNRALRCLLASAEFLRAQAVRHVFFDDYSLSSRASQLLANIIAEVSITITADPFAAGKVFESYPYAAGSVEFFRLYPQAKVEYLIEYHGPAFVADILNRVRQDDAFVPRFSLDTEGFCALVASDFHSVQDDCEGSFSEQVSQNPEDEAKGIAEFVLRYRKQGVAASDICVVAPNSTYGDYLCRALRQEGIVCGEDSSSTSFSSGEKGSRNTEEGRMLSLLALTADSKNDLAWRSILGFGDSLAMSYAVKSLRGYARKHGLALHDLMAQVAGCVPDETANLASAGSSTGVDVSEEQQGDVATDELSAAAASSGAQETTADYPSDFPSLPARLVRIVQATFCQLERLRGLCGTDLLLAVAKSVSGQPGGELSKEYLERFGHVDDSADAAVLYTRLRRSLELSSLVSAAGDESCVLCLADGLCASLPSVVLCAGMVNGFLPPRRYFDKTAVLEKEARGMWSEGIYRLYSIIGKCSGSLIVSSFSSCDPHQAQKFDLKVDRIRAHEGERVCMIGKSAYADILAGKE